MLSAVEQNEAERIRVRLQDARRAVGAAPPAPDRIAFEQPNGSLLRWAAISSPLFMLPAIGAVLLPALIVSCQSSSKTFTIRTHPEGAVVWVDDEPRGETDFEKLVVSFEKHDSAMIRVEKDGFQPQGLVVDAESPQTLNFVLEIAPNNETVLYRLGDYPSQAQSGDRPEGFYDYLRYLWVADGRRGWAAFGDPVYSTREAWMAFVSSRHMRRYR